MSLGCCIWTLFHSAFEPLIHGKLRSQEGLTSYLDMAILGKASQQWYFFSRRKYVSYPTVLQTRLVPGFSQLLNQSAFVAECNGGGGPTYREQAILSRSGSSVMWNVPTGYPSEVQIEVALPLFLSYKHAMWWMMAVVVQLSRGHNECPSSCGLQTNKI